MIKKWEVLFNIVIFNEDRSLEATFNYIEYKTNKAINIALVYIRFNKYISEILRNIDIELRVEVS